VKHAINPRNDLQAEGTKMSEIKIEVSVEVSQEDVAETVKAAVMKHVGNRVQLLIDSYSFQQQVRDTVNEMATAELERAVASLLNDADELREKVSKEFVAKIQRSLTAAMKKAEQA